MRRRLGKSPARPGAISLRFSEIFRAARLPTPPEVFGHESLVTDFGMLANDSYGDCVLAGAAHEHMIWTREGSGTPAAFTDAGVLSDYAAITGFDATRPETDQGTDMQVAAKYRQSIGVVDASGTRHCIAAYMSLKAGDVDEIVLAAWLMGAAGFGMRFPSSAEDQFDSGKPWDVVPGDAIEGGHYVPVVGRVAGGNLVVVTWGRLQQVTPAFYEQFCDESVAYFSPEIVSPTKLSPEGFDAAALGQFLQEINQ